MHDVSLPTDGHCACRRSGNGSQRQGSDGDAVVDLRPEGVPTGHGHKNKPGTVDQPRAARDETRCNCQQSHGTRNGVRHLGIFRARVSEGF